jgi:hypothetical protein
MFENPIKIVKIKNNVYAFKYLNGCININGTKYFNYSLTAAIKEYRSKNK